MPSPRGSGDNSDQRTVLYVNHTPAVSGAERSLLDLLAALPESIRPVVACPDGPFADRIHAVGIQRHPIHGTSGSLRLHPWHTVRASADMARAALDVRRLVEATVADLVHANSIRGGMIAGMACARRDVPLLIHVRDRLPPGKPAELSLELIARSADMLVANSQYSAEALPTGPRHAPKRVIPNPVDLERFDPARVSRDEARTRFEIASSEMVLAVIAQITPWKAQDDAIRCLARLRQQGLPARLLVVGEPTFTAAATRFDNVAFLKTLLALRDELDVRSSVEFTGVVEDIPLVMAAADLVLVPSWAEPFGRTVIEGMAMGVPVLATEVGGPAEIITNGTNGVLLPPGRPELWADAAADILHDPERSGRLSEMGRRTVAEKYTARHHVQAVLGLYHELLDGSVALRAEPIPS